MSTYGRWGVIMEPDYYWPSRRGDVWLVVDNAFDRRVAALCRNNRDAVWIASALALQDDAVKT